ncbi:13732_t:CDS:2 [Cetraspora pellucida]|uniref:13732_t:CDS:1 n=1 Tax=Cetraspora pellucida TaxID=1433469 RepID=A0A9N8ZKA2_9GLOM|nr:13732_t:CDS:2 [Cetraspora pellucida]
MTYTNHLICLNYISQKKFKNFKDKLASTNVKRGMAITHNYNFSIF